METAFLMVEFDEDIYMDVPEGSDVSLNECVKLEKTMYGLVQAARQYEEVFTAALRKVGFQGGIADP